MKMGIHTKTTLITAIIAVPFAVSGGCVWRQGVASGDVFYYYDFLGSMAYTVLGFPLAPLGMWAMAPLRFDQHWWQIPTLSALVIIQWVIWANVIVWFGRKYFGRTPKTESQSGPVTD